MDEQQRQIGPVTQDDPIPPGLYPAITTPGDDDILMVAVFKNTSDARACAEDLQSQGLGLEILALPRRGDGPEQSDIPGASMPEFGVPGAPMPGIGDGAPERAENPMGTSVAVGATIGATTGLIAATQVIPGLLGAGTLLTTLAGAGIGSFLGGLWEVQTRAPGHAGEDPPAQVRDDGVILLVRSSPEQADEVRAAIAFWDPRELRVQ